MSDHTEATIRASSDNCDAGPDCRICRDVRPLLRLLDEARAERDALREDAERFAWWFVHSGRGFDIREYLTGIAMQWDLDMWREKNRQGDGGEAMTTEAEYRALCDSLRYRPVATTAAQMKEAACVIESLLAENAELRRRDDEAAEHVEAVIALRTNFTGEPPYVGWRGLGMALTAALDERDALAQALHIYGEHRDYCRSGEFTREVDAAGNAASRPCTCGLEDALERYPLAAKE